MLFYFTVVLILSWAAPSVRAAYEMVLKVTFNSTSGRIVQARGLWISGKLGFFQLSSLGWTTYVVIVGSVFCCGKGHNTEPRFSFATRTVCTLHVPTQYPPEQEPCHYEAFQCKIENLCVLVWTLIAFLSRLSGLLRHARVCKETLPV